MVRKLWKPATVTSLKLKVEHGRFDESCNWAEIFASRYDQVQWAARAVSSTVPADPLRSSMLPTCESAITKDGVLFVIKKMKAGRAAVEIPP